MATPLHPLFDPSVSDVELSRLAGSDRPVPCGSCGGDLRIGPVHTHGRAGQRLTRGRNHAHPSPGWHHDDCCKLAPPRPIPPPKPTPAWRLAQRARRALRR